MLLPSTNPEFIWRDIAFLPGAISFFNPLQKDGIKLSYDSIKASNKSVLPPNIVSWKLYVEQAKRRAEKKRTSNKVTWENEGCFLPWN